MNRLLLLTGLIVALATHCVSGQVLADDAEGKTSIVQYSNSVNLDLAKAALSVGYNNFRAFKIADQPQRLWGLSASARNADGIGTLFSAGKFQPQSRLQGFVGIRTKQISRRDQTDLAYLRQQLNNVTDAHAVARLKALKNHRPAIDSLLSRQKTLTLVDRVAIKKAIDGLLDNATTGNALAQSLDSLRSVYASTQPARSAAVVAIRDLIGVREQAATRLDADVQALFARRLELTRQINELNVPRRYRLLYLSGGLNASSFRLYDPSLAGTPGNRFTRTAYRGGFVDLGVNYDFRAHWLLGASVGYERANTFDNLASTDYTIRTTETVGNQQLISETKYTGYSGDFRLYDRANIRTDLLYFKALPDSDNQLAWNILYTRSFVSFDEQAAKSRIDLGTALNLYNVRKGNFLGGLYLEATDITNSQQADSNVFGRLSFGIVAKYAFQSIVNRF